MFKRLKTLLQDYFYLFGIVAIIVGVALCTWLLKSESSFIAKQTQFDAELLTANLNYQLTEFKNAMGRMAARLRSVNQSSDPTVWVKDANAYMEEFSGLTAILYLKNNMQIIDVVAIEEKQNIVGKHLEDYAEIRKTIEDAAYNYEAEFGDRPIPFFSGNLFYGVFPIAVADQIEGYLITVVDYDKWLPKRLSSNEFLIRFYSQNFEKFTQTLPEAQALAKNYMTTTEIKIPGLQWRLQFTPSWKVVALQQTMLPWVALGFGFVIAFMFATYGYLQRELDATKLKQFNSVRLQEIAEVVAGLSHEVNNPLAIVQGAVYQLQRRIQDTQIDRQKLLATVDKIDRASQRITRVVEGLRLFAREGSLDPFSETSVGEIFDSVRALCGTRLEDKNIKFTVRDYTRDCVFESITGQIVRVIITLINNSYDAIESSSNGWINLDAQDLGDALEFSVTDSGTGIPESLRNKLMNPFFTTKDPGKGTGLGLSMARGIANGHNGQLLLDENAQNTRFILRIPKRHKLEKAA